MKKLLLLLLFIPLFFSCGNNQKEVDIKIINPLQLDIEKPEGWYSVDIDTDKNIENLQKSDFNTDQLDKIIETTQGNLPLISYTKYDMDRVEGLTPTINVTLVKNYTSNFEEFQDFMNNSVKQFQDMLNNFEITSPIQEIDIAGFKSIGFVGTYDLPIYDSTYKTRVWTYAVPMDSYIYQINFIDFIESEDCSDLYNDLLKSIRIREN